MHKISILKVSFLLLVLSTELPQNIKLSAIQPDMQYSTNIYQVSTLCKGPRPVNTTDCKNGKLPLLLLTKGLFSLPSSLHWKITDMYEAVGDPFQF